jgi:nonribosomal peptide synthetase DhbF
MYGITETTVHVTYYPLAKAIIGSATRSPIGRSISDLQAYVLDENLQLVPIGTAGELYISGEGLARGYLRRPSLTAERFVANPYSPTGERMYRTGDIAKWRADGVLEYLDRSDHQVKIRGFRVELGEIESIIGAHPSVAQVAVLASEDHLGRKYLSCYVVGRTGRANVDVLRKHAIQHLPDYMLPAFYISLTELPLTANGKLNRNALPVPGNEKITRICYVPPRNVTESLIATIFGDILGLERIGVDDSFFALGGDSILSLKFVARLRNAGLNATLRRVYPVSESRKR